MENGTYTLERLARFKIWDLTTDEQAHLRERLAAVTTTPPEKWVAPQALRLASNPHRYLLRLDDEWGATVDVDGGPPYKVQDIFLHAGREVFAEAGANNKK